MSNCQDVVASGVASANSISLQEQNIAESKWQRGLCVRTMQQARVHIRGQLASANNGCQITEERQNLFYVLCTSSARSSSA